jgi:VIT1/CCC1 family predicted Fe2+/Mn2+ transporter
LDFCWNNGASIFYRSISQPYILLFLLLTRKAGGLIPMIPYFAMRNVTHALFISIGITFIILLAFGFVKNYISVKKKRSGLYGAVQTLAVGSLAAGASYGIVRALDSHSSLSANREVPPYIRVPNARSGGGY